MKKTTIASLEAQLLAVKDEIKFLKSSNLYTSVASVIIVLILGFVCFSIF